MKTSYRLGISADALWALGLSLPGLYSIITGTPEFTPDFQTRQIMQVAAILLSGWTILLIWGVRNPIERRFVIILTAFVVFGLFLVAANGFLAGEKVFLWVLIKSPLLFISMIVSFVLSEKTGKDHL